MVRVWYVCHYDIGIFEFSELWGRGQEFVNLYFESDAGRLYFE